MRRSGGAEAVAEDDNILLIFKPNLFHILLMELIKILKGLESHFRIPRDHFRININPCNDVVAAIQLKQARRKPNLIFSAEEFERKTPQREREIWSWVV